MGSPGLADPRQLCRDSLRPDLRLGTMVATLGNGKPGRAIGFGGFRYRERIGCPRAWQHSLFPGHRRISLLRSATDEDLRCGIIVGSRSLGFISRRPSASQYVALARSGLVSGNGYSLGVVGVWRVALCSHTRSSPTGKPPRWAALLNEQPTGLFEERVGLGKTFVDLVPIHDVPPGF